MVKMITPQFAVMIVSKNSKNRAILEWTLAFAAAVLIKADEKNTQPMPGLHSVVTQPIQDFTGVAWVCQLSPFNFKMIA